MIHTFIRTSRIACAAMIGAAAIFGTPSLRASEPAPNPRLHTLLEEDFESQKRFDPLEAGRRGDRRFDSKMPDLSAAGREAIVTDAKARLSQLGEIDPQTLTASDRVNYALLRWELNGRIESTRFEPWKMPITQQNGPQISLPQLPDFLSFTTDQHYNDYLARLEAIPEYLDQLIENMRTGLREGRTPPKVVMGTVAAQAGAHGLDRYSEFPQEHAMYRPFFNAKEEVASRAKRVIASEVAPAFKRYETFLRDEYVPHCRETIAASDLPNGQALYAYLINRMTTTDLTAQQIHQIGLGEVARIRAEMMEVIARSDFPQKDSLKGDELFKAFVHYLRTDPRFYFTNEEDLLTRYQVIAKRIDPEMPRLFRTLPRLAYGVREMPRFIAPAAPTAYYYPGSLKNGVPGYFIANTSLLDQRPKYEMISLTLHEAVPGHHHQIALLEELKDAGLPEWRSTVDFTVFVEGWGLYAERLGLEMGDDPRSPSNPHGKGLFTDPYDDFGRLSYEMWRAMRLVVDTGMHALGWERDRAIAYMLDNSALSSANIEREIDRYIAWPAQALAYKIGELKIRDLRSQAEAELGDRFDIRAFHDILLLQGAVPLELMERQVKDWIAQVKAESSPAR